MILLLFGQPASGKSTLSDALTAEDNLSKFRQSMFFELSTQKIIKIDGDKWREVTKNKDYSKNGRLQNLKGAFDMALYLEKEGYIVILSFVTPYQELRDYLKNSAKDLLQVYLTYPGGRGRDERFADDFEKPNDVLTIDTSVLNIKDSVTIILKALSQILSK